MITHLQSIDEVNNGEPNLHSSKCLHGIVFHLPFNSKGKGKGKGKVVPVFNQLSTTPFRRMGEWTYRPMFS
jgi:hypothetical protein